MDLCDIRTIKALLGRHGFRFSKSMGQNFLIEDWVPRDIADASGASPDSGVLEIGPGIGPLTVQLAQRAAKVAAVELDRTLYPILDETLAPYDNVEVVPGDVMKLDLAQVIQEEFGGGPVCVCANLPYYITSPVILRLLEEHLPLTSITVMVQKEVADRMQVGPGTKDYGALSLAVQYYAEPEIVANVPPNCFMPRPNVGSAVIRLSVYEEPPVKVKDEKLLFAIIRASFNQRRKTLQNGLGHVPELGIPKEMTVQILEEMGLPASVRGEALTLEQFAGFANRAASLKEQS